MPWNFRNINVENIIFNFMSVIVLNGHFNCNSSHLECMVLIYGCVGLIVIFVSFILFLKNVFLVFLLFFFFFDKGIDCAIAFESFGPR